MTVRIEMTMATIGRSMKKRAMASPPGGGGGRRGWRGQGGWGAEGGGLRRRLARLHLDACLDAREALDHDALARLQAALDHPEGADPLPGLDVADLGAVVGADDGDLAPALQLVDGAL